MFIKLFAMPKKQQIYQTGTINSLINAVYDGDTSVGELKEHGDFGLGTFDMVDGEMIVCDNIYYRADVDGNLSVVADAVITPFAVVNRFIPSQEVGLHNKTYENIEEYLQKFFPSKNMIYAIKIEGSFSTMLLRSESCQPRTYKKMNETMPELQKTFTKENIEGTLVGVWFPQYLEQLNVPGFHFHFVDKERQTGGHVFNFNLEKGRAYIQVLKSLQVDLIDNDEFATAELVADSDAIHQVEKQRQ